MTPLARELARALLAAVREDDDLRAELRALLEPERETSVSPWLAVAEAAAYLRVSERTIERMAESNGKKPPRLRSSTIGRRRLYHRDDLDALARAATGEDVAPTTPSRRRGE